MTLKCLHHMMQECVTELLDICMPSCDLCSAMELRLCERHANLKSVGGRFFSIIMIMAPKLFNSLPKDLMETTSLTTFKSKLKRFLFRKFYYDIMVS